MIKNSVFTRKCSKFSKYVKFHKYPPFEHENVLSEARVKTDRDDGKGRGPRPKSNVCLLFLVKIFAKVGKAFDVHAVKRISKTAILGKMMAFDRD